MLLKSAGRHEYDFIQHKDALVRKSFDSRKSRGRRYKDSLRDREINAYKCVDPFLADYMKITESKPYRRLAHKTQVLCSPDNENVRTRLSHTAEVINRSLLISETLGLNTPLCMSIAAGHDIGHTPYGHLGEDFLSKETDGKFKHQINSVILAQLFGMNLTFETLEGMLYHSRGDKKLHVNHSLPDEYSAVMFADKIAYTFADVNDSIRYGYLDESRLPKGLKKLGLDQKERTFKCIESLIKESAESGTVSFSNGEVFEIFEETRRFMYKNVYHKLNWEVNIKILEEAYKFLQGPEFSGCDPVELLSLLTDYEVNHIGNILKNVIRPTLDRMKDFGTEELIPILKGKKIEHGNPGLDWGNKRVAKTV